MIMIGINNKKLALLHNVLFILMLLLCGGSIIYFYLSDDELRMDLVSLVIGFLIYIFWRIIKRDNQSISTLQKIPHKLKDNKNKQNSKSVNDKNIRADNISFIVELQKKWQQEHSKVQQNSKGLSSITNKSAILDKKLNRSFTKSKKEFVDSNLSGSEQDFQYLFSENKRTQTKFENKKLEFISEESDISSGKRTNNKLNQTIIQNMKEATRRYVKTLEKANQNSKFILSKYSRISREVRKVCCQVYNQNIKNLLEIIEFLQSIYQIDIHCKDLKDLESKEVNFSGKMISLTDCFKILYEKEDFRFPWKKKPSSFQKEKGKMLDKFQKHESSKLAQKQVKKLKILLIQRFKLDQQLERTSNHLSNQARLIAIKRLKNYIDLKEENEEYRFQDALNISQNSSKEKCIALRIFIHYINQVMMRKQLQIYEEEETSWFYFLKQKKFRHFTVVKTLSNDFGHPHFDIKLAMLDQNEEMYYCQFGPKNYLSVIFMLLWNLREKFPDAINQSPTLQKIITSTIGMS